MKCNLINRRIKIMFTRVDNLNTTSRLKNESTLTKLIKGKRFTFLETILLINFLWFLNLNKHSN